MKILLLADINSSHTRKWVEELSGNGFRIGVFSISGPTSEWYLPLNIEVFAPLSFSSSIYSDSLLSKIRYLRLLPYLKSVIRNFNPEIVHAHYASSYGLLGALSGFHPLVISVWGSDIYFFSKVPVIGKEILKFNFRRADLILSTSNDMLREISKHTRKEIHVTPFGVDVELFRPVASKPFFNKGDIVIGTVKSLEECYGINYLILAFSKLVSRHPDLPLKLLLVGGGTLENELRELGGNLGLTGKIHFTGKVAFDEVPLYHNYLDIYVALSISESFGVAVLEASACAKPVVVSDAGGLPEVVMDGVTGFIVASRDVEQAADALSKLVENAELRKEMGENGREFVKSQYNVNELARKMKPLYQQLINNK